VHHESGGTYGVPRITAKLGETGERINHKRIARVMRSIGLAGVRLRRRHRTTTADPAAAKASVLIGRDFTSREPNTKYAGDITYLPLEGGKFLYLATVIDLASRRLAGWSIADHMRTELVTDALAAAERTRGSLTGAVLHTDHGAEYTSTQFCDRIRELGLRNSCGRTGSCFDNAAAESFWALLKEEIGTPIWPDRATARAEVFTFIETFYNRRRLRKHKTFGYLTPAETRQRHQHALAA